MAAILDLVLSGKVSANITVDWLTNSHNESEVPECLAELSKYKTEFIPFFLNFLRDQSMHLLQSGKSALPSPAKTPVLEVKKKKVPKDTSSQKKASVTTKRVQLFTISTPQNQSNETQTSNPFNASIESPGFLEHRFTGSNKKSPGQFSNTCTPDSSFNTSGHRTPDSYRRTKHKHSLGEFLITPDSYQQRKTGKRRDLEQRTSSPLLDRKITGKGKNQFSKFKAKNTVEVQQTHASPKPPTFDLDEFPSLGTTKTASKSSAPSRRITPTPITQITSRPTNQIFSSEQGNQMNSRDDKSIPPNLEEERKLLREKRAEQDHGAKVQTTSPNQTPNTPSKNSTVTTTTPSKYFLERMSSVSEILTANRMDVTLEDKLELMAELYSGCLNANLVPNISVELYFTIQLLTVRGMDMDIKEEGDKDFESDHKYLESVHNAVYFATLVLEKQLSSLSYLDKGTVRLLLDNPRVEEFSIELKLKLSVLYSDCTMKSQTTFCPSPIGGVSFQADTDNRQNFPNDRCFHQFKKQRDLFYELIREWEANHLTPGWSLIESHGYKIKSLVSATNELINHVHFARLFQSQLIMMCKGGQSLKSEDDSSDLSLLSKLKQTNPEKYKRLQQRFITPANSSGPCPAPGFPGPQEFFRDFILAASSSVFNQHLTDSIAAKVKELDNTNFEWQDIEGNEENQEDLDMFASCLLTLRLLGKFLGFIVFLPYQTPEPIPDAIQASYIEIRSRTTPPIDVLQCLKSSCASNRSILTVPWVIEYLSMMDRIAPSLDYFREVFQLLINLHKQIGFHLQSQEVCFNYFFLNVILGWFFQTPYFPEELFFSDIISHPDCCIQILHGSLDSIPLVDNQLLYTCCPYLGEIKSLLVEFAVGLSSRVSTLRKITPVSAEIQAAPSITDRNIQLQLEENFFHNHPASLKRTVEFVADRVASNHIKRFRAHVLPKLQKEGYQRVNDMVENGQAGSPDKIKGKLAQQVYDISQALSEKARSSLKGTAPSYCQEKAETILALLLPEETKSSVVAIATQIACRLGEERINQWMNTHITVGIFNKELKFELDKLIKVSLGLKPNVSPTKPVRQISDSEGKSGGAIKMVQTNPTNIEIASPSDVLNEMKDLVMSMSILKQPIEAETICQLLKKVIINLKETEDIFPAVYKSYGQLAMELGFTLAVQQPHDLTDVSLELLIAIWQQTKEVTPLASLLSTRCIYTLSKSQHPKASWQAYTTMMCALVSCKLMNIQKLEANGLKVTQLQLTQETLDHFSRCICDIAKQIHQDIKPLKASCDIKQNKSEDKWTMPPENFSTDFAENELISSQNKIGAILNDANDNNVQYRSREGNPNPSSQFSTPATSLIGDEKVKPAHEDCDEKNDQKNDEKLCDDTAFYELLDQLYLITKEQSAGSNTVVAQCISELF